MLFLMQNPIPYQKLIETSKCTGKKECWCNKSIVKLFHHHISWIAWLNHWLSLFETYEISIELLGKSLKSSCVIQDEMNVGNETIYMHIRFFILYFLPGGLGFTCNSGFNSALHMSTSLQHFMTNVSLVFWEYSHWTGFSGG